MSVIGAPMVNGNSFQGIIHLIILVFFTSGVKTEAKISVEGRTLYRMLTHMY